MILHTVNKSCFKDNTLQHCLSRLGNEDILLLIEDGVYSIQHSDSLQQLLSLDNENRCFILKADLSARGIKNTLSENALIDYTDFVALTTKASAVQSWY